MLDLKSSKVGEYRLVPDRRRHLLLVMGTGAVISIGKKNRVEGSSYIGVRTAWLSGQLVQGLGFSSDQTDVAFLRFFCCLRPSGTWSF